MMNRFGRTSAISPTSPDSPEQYPPTGPLADDTKIVISAGFHKTHETAAAREASRRALLRVCITGAYPTERIKRVVRRLRLADRRRIARLLDRDEGIPRGQLKPLFLPELLDEIADILGRHRLLDPLH